MALPSIILTTINAAGSLAFTTSAADNDNNKMALETTTTPAYDLCYDLRQSSLENCILPLSETSYKGSSGKVAVLGGSAKYTGAPYYAAMASLKTGSDLAWVLTAEEAAIPIKCYSPELIVIPVYRAADFDQAEKEQKAKGLPLMESERCQALVENMVAEVRNQIEVVHCLVVGPGLGRSALLMEAVALVIELAKDKGLHIVLDADALFMLSLPQYRDLLQNYQRAVITPNAMEYKRLFPTEEKGEGSTETVPDVSFLAGVTVVRKGLYDEIEVDGTVVRTCKEPGGLKRSGGIGDVLAGTLATLISWKVILEKQEHAVDLPTSVWTACWFVKRATSKAFKHKRRSMTAPDVLVELESSLDDFQDIQKYEYQGPIEF